MIQWEWRTRVENGECGDVNEECDWGMRMEDANVGRECGMRGCGTSCCEQCKGKHMRDDKAIRRAMGDVQRGSVKLGVRSAEGGVEGHEGGGTSIKDVHDQRSPSAKSP